jgi:hypothetical protein
MPKGKDPRITKTGVAGYNKPKRRGQRSPDVADAFVLTFAGQGAVAGGYSRGYNSNRSLKPKTNWVV